MSDQPNAGATSETAQTRKTIHTKHTLSHHNKANMEWWLRRPNDIRGPWGPKVSWHLSYRWGKTLKKPRPGNLSRLGIEPGPAAWQGRVLPLAPQRWTSVKYCIKNQRETGQIIMSEKWFRCNTTKIWRGLGITRLRGIASWRWLEWHKNPIPSFILWNIRQCTQPNQRFESLKTLKFLQLFEENNIKIFSEKAFLHSKETLVSTSILLNFEVNCVLCTRQMNILYTDGCI